jgi:hypothetical protein
MNTINIKNFRDVKKIKPTNNITIIRTNMNKTPNKNQIKFSSSNNDLLSLTSINERNKTFINCKNNIYSKSLKKLNYFETSISPTNERNIISFKNKFFDVLKSRSISKNKIDKFIKKISNSKIKLENNKKSKSNSKGKKTILKNKNNNIINQKKKIPFISNYNYNIKTKKINMTNSKESINTVSTSIYSNNLTEKEKNILITIQNLLFNILFNSQNQKDILKEFELIYQRAISFSNSNLISKNRNYSDDNLFNQLNQINLKFVEIEKENKELKNLIKEKISGFEDVKNSIKNVQDEINKIKTLNEENLIKNSNLNYISMKNVKMNDIKKVNGIEEIKSEKNSLNESIDSIKIIQPNENIQKKNTELKLNFNGLEEYKNSFNEIFLSNYNQFSASWRKDADKIMERINNNNM